MFVFQGTVFGKPGSPAAKDSGGAITPVSLDNLAGYKSMKGMLDQVRVGLVRFKDLYFSTTLKDENLYVEVRKNLIADAQSLLPMLTQYLDSKPKDSPMRIDFEHGALYLNSLIELIAKNVVLAPDRPGKPGSLKIYEDTLKQLDSQLAQLIRNAEREEFPAKQKEEKKANAKLRQIPLRSVPKKQETKKVDKEQVKKWLETLPNLKNQITQIAAANKVTADMIYAAVAQEFNADFSPSKAQLLADGDPKKHSDWLGAIVGNVRGKYPRAYKLEK